ncbi:MAG: hypothetical protein JNM84_09885 [Planctomycetes bacterium]|nr:hypothetical protein [Planctomycetota bacterium]
MNDSLPEDLLDEREPTPEEWAECASALRSLGLDSERGGARDDASARDAGLGDSGDSHGASADTSAFLQHLVALDRSRARAIGRSSRRRRFALRETLIEAGFRVEQGSRWTRGTRLALAYGALRFRESRALRVAAALLFVNLLAVPVTAWVTRQERASEVLFHGLHPGNVLNPPELLAEEPYLELEAEDPRELLEPREDR